MKPRPEDNPLLERSPLPLAAVPFDRVQSEHFMPALQGAIETANAELEKLKIATEPACFENTILILEEAMEPMERVSLTFSNLFSAECGEGLRQIASEFEAKVSEFTNDVILDSKLFARIDECYQRKQTLQLNHEQEHLLEKTWKEFVRNGALLDQQQKKKLREYDTRIAQLSVKFSENTLNASNDFQLEISNHKDLSGLPEAAVEAARETARSIGKDSSWIFTLQYPSYIAFMTHADNRKLREKMFRAFSSRAYGGKFDNKDIIKTIARLRFERAKLLGYHDHAEYVLQERMAQSIDRVRTFLARIEEIAMPIAQKDTENVQSFARKHGAPAVLEKWDFAYWAEKLKRHRFNIDSETLRPYFQLEKVIDGVFAVAQKLYGLQFKQIHHLPTWHEEVITWEVLDHDGSFLGLLYGDFFPRKTKRSGAWMSTYRNQGLTRGEIARPHVSIVCNFTRPTATKPALLDFKEVQTLFHEFGHALHALLSKVTYRTLAGPNVYWDFVELPSQIMENWTYQKDALDLFAEHYQSGKRFPSDLCKRLKESATFNEGYATVRQLTFAHLDLAWHSGDPTRIENVGQYEDSVLKRFELLPSVKGCNISCAFNHIFSGGYSAGYYSYKWAEVLDADAFEMFAERGIFDPETATSFRNEILEKGGTVHPLDLYRSFRGREPDPDALLRRAGLLR